MPMWRARGRALDSEVPGHRDNDDDHGCGVTVRPCGVTSGPGRVTSLRILTRIRFESENCDRLGPLVGDTRVGRAHSQPPTWPEQGTMKNTQ